MPRSLRAYLWDIEQAASDEQQIIAFRNRLIHGYATVRNALVWDIVQVNLPRLLEQVAQLRSELDTQGN